MQVFRRFSQADVSGIRRLIGGHPEWTRRRLSIELSEHWNWRNKAGRLKDMSCRNLLLNHSPLPDWGSP